jgi:hypothetical protein
VVTGSTIDLIVATDVGIGPAWALVTSSAPAAARTAVRREFENLMTISVLCGRALARPSTVYSEEARLWRA